MIPSYVDRGVEGQNMCYIITQFRIICYIIWQIQGICYTFSQSRAICYIISHYSLGLTWI